MKLFCALACSLVAVATAFATVNPQLLQVKHVYILAMGSGMDQYLANQLTSAGVFVVVTDPTKADAILTDQVGEAFQKKLDDLYPPPPKPEDAKAKAAKSEAAASNSTLDVGDGGSDAKSKKKDPFEGVDFSGGDGFRSGSGFTRGKGNFFLVDRGSRTVLWSVYERPKNSTSGELTKTAGRVVKHLKYDMTDKKPSE
jgi:hypothetical protein